MGYLVMMAEGAGAEVADFHDLPDLKFEITEAHGRRVFKVRNVQLEILLIVSVISLTDTKHIITTITITITA